MPPEQTIRIIRAQDLSVRCTMAPPRDMTGWAITFIVRDALAGTAYQREHMLGTEPIPRSVLEELAERACLCRLPDYRANSLRPRRISSAAGAPSPSAATDAATATRVYLVGHYDHEVANKDDPCLKIVPVYCANGDPHRKLAAFDARLKAVAISWPSFAQGPAKTTRPFAGMTTSMPAGVDVMTRPSAREKESFLRHDSK